MALVRGVADFLCIVLLLKINLCYAGAPNDCGQIGICEKAKNYPTELAKKLIQELKNKNTIFNYDEKHVSLDARGGFAESKSLCNFREEYIAPQQAKDRKGVMRFILNDDKDPVQRFRVEICDTKEASCSKQIHFIPGYRGVCIQKMTQREMIYLDENTKQSAVEYFETPTCCTCSLFFTK